MSSNVARHLRAMAERQPAAPALIIQRGSEYEIVSYKELDEDSGAIARGLAESGVERGARTVLMVPPGRDFFAATFALLKLGAPPVLIDPGIGARHMGDCVNEAEPAAFIGIAKAHAARVLMGWGRRTLKTLVAAGTRWLPGAQTLDGLRARGKEHPLPCIESESGETAAILFTSGSTGPPKGAVYTHGIFSRQAEVLREVYGIEPGERDLGTFPLFALFGPALGMTSIVPEMDFARPASADPARLAAAVTRWEATSLFGSPALLDTLTRYTEAQGIRFPSLRRAISAGAPVRPDILRRAARMLPPGAQVYTPYGATEALPVSNIGHEEVLGETAKLTEQGRGVCVGRPVGGIEVRIIRLTDDPIASWSSDLLLPDGEIGEIAVRGEVVTRAYCNRPEADRLAKIADGADIWHRMGDAGYRDSDGRLWMCGRKSHRVETAAGTRYTVPAEGIFNAHPRVRRSALVGVGARGSQRPVLCVELEESGCCDAAAQGAIRQHLLDLAKLYPQTREIRDVLFHPGFPVDIRHNAKIFREQLAEWASGR